MDRVEQALSQWIIRRRWWLLLLLPLLVVWAGNGMNKLYFSGDYRVFFSADNPQLRDFEQMERTYTKNDNVIFLLKPVEGDVYQPRVLAALEWLTEQSWQLPYATRVDSLNNYQHTEAEGDELIVRDLYENGAALSPAQLNEVRRVSLGEPLLNGKLVPDSARVTLVNATIHLPGKDEIREVPEVVFAARELQNRFREAYPDIEIFLSGMVVMNANFSESSMADMQTLVPISFAIMLVVLGVLLRSLAAIFATLLVIILSIIAGMGLAGYIGYPITPPSAISPNLILTMAIASSVHVLVSFNHHLNLGRDKHQAMAESLRVNLQPVFLTSLTTTIGFLSLNFSEVPPFRHMGNIVAFGVIASFFLSIGFLPALMCILPIKPKNNADPGHRFMRRFGDWVIQRRKPLLWTNGGLILVLLLFLPLNQLNDVFVRYFDERVDFRQATDELDRHLGGLYRLDFSLGADRPNGISDPEFLRQVEQFAQWLRQQPEVTQVTSLTDIFKRLNKNLHADEQQWYRLPDQSDMAAQYLLLYEMSLPFGLDLNDQIDVAKSAIRLSVSTRVLSTQEILDLQTQAEDWLAANAPKLHNMSASPTLMFAHIGYRNIRSMLIGTTLALLLISLLLVIALRSIKIGLISMIPNLVPAAMGFGLWGLLVGEVGLSLSVVTGMTLGIVVDDTVHFLSKYLRARREGGLSSEDAVRGAFEQVGMALLVTTVVLMAGFLVLALSSFYLNAGMGLLTAIVLGFALLADFLFLPPLLIKLEKSEESCRVG